MITVSRSSTSPNVNCLEGKRCPECGSYGPFEVLVSMRVLLCDSGIGDADDGTTWYDSDAPTKCDSCGHAGKFGDFDERPQ